MPPKKDVSSASETSKTNLQLPKGYVDSASIELEQKNIKVSQPFHRSQKVTIDVPKASFEIMVPFIPPSEDELPEEEKLITISERICLFLKIYWKTICFFLIPILLSPIYSIQHTPDCALLYLIVVMGFFWVLNILPYPITGMIPLAVFPLFGILDSDKTVAAYTKEVIIMFILALIIAVAIKDSHLPKRIALYIIRAVGYSHYRLVFSFSLTTMLMSMWISNSAATSMMLPLVKYLLNVLDENAIIIMFETKVDHLGENKQIPTDLTICYFVMIAYSATIGGLGTLVGTPTNMVFKGYLESRFPGADHITFTTFIGLTLPQMLLIELAVFLSVVLTFIGWKKGRIEDQKLMSDIIKEQCSMLGPMTFLEKSAAILFLLLVFFYFTRSPGWFKGWAEALIDENYIHNSCSVSLLVMSIFLIPPDTTFLSFFNTSKGIDELPQMTSQGMITWDLVNRKVYWELIFLLGAGFAIAKASKNCGLTNLLENYLGFLKNFPPLAIVIVMVLIIAILTEVTTNMAIANLILPIIAEVAVIIKTHPMYLMLPITLTCSLSFHTPVSTPPNAMIMAYVGIPSKKMMIAGIGPTILSSIIIIIGCGFYVPLVLPEISKYPEWADD